ncbi:MAG: alpha-galactosidase, partial [Clostridia bacterium]|nr:alpha-galactosidase [Clostridia bacterium]
MKPYANVFYQPGENPVFCYRTGMTVYEEVLHKGVLVSGGWNGAGYPQNVLTNCPSRLNPRLFREPFTFNLEINGRSAEYDLSLVDFAAKEEGEGVHAILTLKSNVVPVEIGVHTLLDGSAMFSRWLTVENKSDAPLTINRLSLLSGGVEAPDMYDRTYDWDPNSYYSVGYFDNDRWGREGEFNWHTLTPGTHNIDFRFFRDRYRHPVMFLRNNVEGSIWFYQIAWSAGCRFSLDYQGLRESSSKDFAARPRLAMKAEITGHTPLYVLEAGECFESPQVHAGMVKGDLDDAVNGMHTHLRRSVLNLPEADASACTVGSGMGAEHDMSVETSKAFIDQFADMGAEIFIIDAGWQNPPHKEMQWVPHNGINHPDPDRYPNGLSELSDYCHRKGMKFALWVEIERLGEYSQVYKDHPDWRAKNIYGEYCQEKNGFLDFTNPAAAAWAEEELARIIAEYKLDMLRVDYNIGPDDYFNMRDVTETGIRECVALRHFRAVYQMYQNLKKRFPHVLFENCAGGGG